MRTFLIPSNNLPTFKSKFEKLIRKANKLNVIPPSYIILKEEIKEIQVLEEQTENHLGQLISHYSSKLVSFSHIQINSPTVVINGYRFVATIEHTEEGNILRNISGTDIPIKFRTCNAYCEHCKTLRRRNDTFVVRNENTGSYIQVGRNCLKDFLGHSAETFASQAELYYEADELGQASESYGGGGGGFESLVYLESYLGFVAEVISRDGWKSRSSAKEYGGQATADVAAKIMKPSKEDIRNNARPFTHPSDASIQMSKDAIAWCENLSDEEVEKSEYLHNIRLIARRGVVGYRQYGYAASIVSGYQRYMGELKQKERQKKMAEESGYVGTVGEKGTFTLLVTHVNTLPDYGYGESCLNLMSDKEGNQFVWKTGNALEVGKEYVLRGTVKEHKEYVSKKTGIGVKQTVLTRCKEVEVMEFTAEYNGERYTVKAENEKEAKKKWCEVWGVGKMPKGAKIV